MDNPSAFPQHPSAMVAGERVWGEPGMTLRDWFAGQALAGILANPALSNPDLTGDTSSAVFAEVAYDAADAMLAARATVSEGEG